MKKQRTKIIAEIGQAHDGSLGILHSYIDLAKKIGIDVVKFQIHIAEAESSPDEAFRIHFSREDKTRFDYWKRMELSLEQWREVKTHCEELGLEFLASPFSLKAVDLLIALDVKRFKIGSGEVQNWLMLEKIAKTGKPILLSSGMSSLEELDETLGFLAKFSSPVILMQCNSQYPTPAERAGLNLIPEMKQRYGLEVGFSDHSGEIFPGISAVALGADWIEAHLVFHKEMFGPDAASSLDPDQFAELVRGIRYIDEALRNPVDKSDLRLFSDMRMMFGKSIAVNKSLSKGHVLTFDDLESKKPAGKGIPAKEYQSVLGRKINKDLEQWSFLNKGDLE